ncbi:MAG: DsbA family protein [Chloroflexota bacterium]|nr:DsbA family protein [Chloroflexota bacterium]
MTGAQPIRIAMYSDPHCPYAYLTAFRLRRLLPEWRDRIVIEHKSLSLEYVNSQPTPKPILDNETPILMLAEPDIPYRPWARPDSEWPVTMWPAFEAIKCAERQGSLLANELDWAIRTAFFAEHRCISMRHVLFDLAAGVGVDMDRFAEDFDGGVTKRQVLEEAREGWERLKVEGSPTFVLPSGRQYPYLALPKVKLDKDRHYRVVAWQPAPCADGDCLDLLRQMFAEAGAETGARV